MNKYILKKGCCILLLIIPYFSFSQSTDDLEKSLCWKISGKSLKQPSYLFGTIHLISKKDFFLNEPVKEVFKTCTTLALEIDLDLSRETKKELAQSAILPNGKAIKDYTSIADYKLIYHFMKDSVRLSGIKTSLYMRLKPLYLQSILLKEQIKKAKSYEEIFLKMANKNKMNQVGLEDAMLQIKVLDTIPIGEQIKDMVESIKCGKASIREFKKMIEVYKSQDINALWKLSVSDDNEIGSFEEIFINNRNQSWLLVIENLISKNSVFIAIGAAHLGGPYGLIKLLQMKGYIVEPCL